MAHAATHALRHLSVPGLLLVAALAMPCSSRAEPAPSTEHVPLLWAAAVAGSLLAGAAPLLFWRLRRRERSVRPYGLAALLLAVAFLLVCGPLVVALGSILLRGRTM